MYKFLYSILFICVFTALYSAEDPIWQNRHTEAGAKKAYEHYKNLCQTKNNYDSCWKFARAAYFYAEHFIQKKKDQKLLFKEGRDAAAKAAELSADRVEGYYWYGVCLGSWAERISVFEQLKRLNEIKATVDRAENIDPKYDNGAIYILRGRIFHKAPGWLGDKKQAEEDYKTAINMGTIRRVVYRFYAELLILLRRKNEAKSILETGIKLPIYEEDHMADKKELEKLKNMLSKMTK